MPLRLPVGKTSRAWIFGVILAAFGIGLAYFELRGAFPSVVGAVLSFLYLIAVAFILRHNPYVARLKKFRPPDQGRSRVWYFATSVVCFVVAVLWAFVAASATKDTPLGNAITAGPSLLILIVGGFYFGRATRIRIQ